jgi:2-methylcitrate dehydratase PrpD
VITQYLARQIATTLPDDAARQSMSHGLMDYFACTLPVSWGGVPDRDLRLLRQQFPPHSLENQALRLGYCSHALDFDDFHPGFRGHPSAVIFSTLLPLLAGRDLSLSHLLDAAVIGIEVAGRLGLAAGSEHYQRGFHNSSTLGCVAAVAAAARLLALDEERIAIALGLAATQAAGLRSQFGTNAKPLHVGLAARNAVSALALARSGFQGQSSGVMEDFLRAHGGESAHPEMLLEPWSSPLRVLRPGLEFKSYATCSGTHSAIEAALDLRRKLQQRFAAPDIWLPLLQRIVVSFPPGADIATSVRSPENGLQARFSLEYVIADALLHGQIALAHYLDAAVDERISQLAGKVSRQADSSAPDDALHPEARFHQLDLFLAGGEVLTQRESRAQTVARPLDIPAKLRQQLSVVTPLDAEQVLASCILSEQQSSTPLLAWLVHEL